MVAVGGFWDGRLKIFDLQNETLIETYIDGSDTILCLKTDRKQRILVSGTKTGLVNLYHIRNWATQGRQLKRIRSISDHDGQINDIFICQDLKAILTCSSDGWAHLYNMYSGKYLRGYRHPRGMSIQNVAIYCTPLYGVILYSKDENVLYSYSINGQYLASIKLKQPICPGFHVVKDSKLNDILVRSYMVSPLGRHPPVR